MKTIYTLAALALFGIASAQTTTSVSNFKNLAVNGDVHVTLIKSSENKLVITADDDEVQVDQENDMLSISGDGHVTLYYKNIETLAASEDCVVTGKDVITGKLFTLVASSDARVTLEMKTDKLNTVATEDAVVTLTGSVKEHTVAIQSDAVLKASGLETDVTSVTASSDAHAAVKAKKVINALADSDAVIEIHGNPEKINNTTDSDGVIKKA
ncbi:hypothetical protein AM493_14255 [Flavobacterium akiainvivens]|uniref:Putative auto-transporter adhesin head GIN domain-containing protein n=1 Tax=Flavobacterium akiainvivens TaxID=1202724 RepID=A0A0M9VIT3_9FLAO|nr:DUF2807 domain-containing protein [Flavobacterium akiainvivens]KOS07066.1 hypothetical protein AM493_14255 [Flavobacterium akiainvivens]SFQ58569.1 Putative auto-transporter adhesin, head GIN domain [Flavobacterium akiainvivens]